MAVCNLSDRIIFSLHGTTVEPPTFAQVLAFCLCSLQGIIPSNRLSTPKAASAKGQTRRALLGNGVTLILLHSLHRFISSSVRQVSHQAGTGW